MISLIILIILIVLIIISGGLFDNYYSVFPEAVLLVVVLSTPMAETFVCLLGISLMIYLSNRFGTSRCRREQNTSSRVKYAMFHQCVLRLSPHLNMFH